MSTPSRQDALNTESGIKDTIQANLRRLTSHLDSTVIDIDQSQKSATGTDQLGSTITVKNAQQFLPTKSTLTGVTFRRQADTGTYAGNVTVSIQADNAGSPSGTDLVSSVILNAAWASITLGTDYTVSLPVTLTVDGFTTYWIVWTSSTVDNSNLTRLNVCAGNLYTAGKWKAYNGSTWNEIGGTNNRDVYFKTLYLKNTIVDATIQDLANIYAGTTGLSTQEALNVAAGTTGLTIQEALNIIAA